MPQTAGAPDTPDPPPNPAPGQVAAHAAMRQAAIVLIAAIIAADQFSKWLILELVMQPARVVEILPFFNVVLVYNRGISFGILGAGSAVQTWLLIALAIIIVVLLLYWLRGATNWVTALAIGAVAGGAVGNIIDRLMPTRRAVVDFLDFHAAGYHWPAFNIADSAIVLGVVALLIASLMKTRDS
ncbi:MAG: signal peptidase II [Alphaproteobacteria bacterium]|nr:signal peptidase II [Alphaproteobacteria bacterium]